MNYHTANFYVEQTLLNKYLLIFQMYVDFIRLELTKYTYQQVVPSFSDSRQLMPVISYYQQLSAVGKSGGGKWGRKRDALLVEIGLTNMSKSVGAIASIVPPVTRAPPADSPELI